MSRTNWCTRRTPFQTRYRCWPPSRYYLSSDRNHEIASAQPGSSVIGVSADEQNQLVYTANAISNTVSVLAALPILPIIRSEPRNRLCPAGKFGDWRERG